MVGVIYFVLALVFQGRYGAGPNAHRDLVTIHQRLFDLMTSVRGEVPAALSQHWQAVGAGEFQLLRNLPPEFDRYARKCLISLT